MPLIVGKDERAPEFFGTSALLNTGMKGLYELTRRRIDFTGRRNDLHKWIEAGRVVSIFALAVRETSQAPEVPPIGRLGIAAKSLREFSRRRGSCFLVETLGMF